MGAFSDEQLAEFLTRGGIPLDSFHLVGEPHSRLIGFWLPDIGLRMMLINDNELSQACKDYLVRIGARQFLNDADLDAAAAREHWPGWESHGC